MSLLRSTELAVTCSVHCPGPLPSSGRGDADPLGSRLLAPVWPQAKPRGVACCCLSAILPHLAGTNLLFVPGCLGGTLVGAKLSETDKKQLGGYFKHNIRCICNSVETNAKTNLQRVYGPVLCFPPFNSSSCRDADSTGICAFRQSLANGPNPYNIFLQFHFFFGLSDSSSSPKERLRKS